MKVLERIIERKYVCLTFEKRGFGQKIETYFIPQLMTSSSHQHEFLCNSSNTRRRTLPGFQIPSAFWKGEHF